MSKIPLQITRHDNIDPRALYNIVLLGMVRSCHHRQEKESTPLAVIFAVVCFDAIPNAFLTEMINRRLSFQDSLDHNISCGFGYKSRKM